MKIGKIEAVLLAGIMVCGTMALALPAMAASDATQTANVYATDAVLIKDQDHTDVVTGWNFTGVASTTVADPENTDSETQNTTANEPVATLVNTNPLAVAITLNAATWSDGPAVTAQKYNISAADDSVTFGSFATLNLGSDTVTGVTIGADNKYRGLYLNATLKATSGTGTSAFTVTCEI